MKGLNGIVSEEARQLVMEIERVEEMGLVGKREVKERVHDWLLLRFEWGKSVLVLRLSRREEEEKVGMEAIEER